MINNVWTYYWIFIQEYFLTKNHNWNIQGIALCLEAMIFTANKVYMLEKELRPTPNPDTVIFLSPQLLYPFTALIYPFLNGESTNKLLFRQPNQLFLGSIYWSELTSSLPWPLLQHLMARTYPSAGRTILCFCSKFVTELLRLVIKAQRNTTLYQWS
jgi:hypothetical protein